MSEYNYNGIRYVSPSWTSVASQTTTSLSDFLTTVYYAQPSAVDYRWATSWERWYGNSKCKLNKNIKVL